MKPRIALIYSTVDGHTRKISSYLQNQLKENNIESDLYALEEFTKEISSYEFIIIGASVRYGHHNKNVIKFINTHKNDLNKIKTAFFSVNLVARKPEKNSPETNPYFIKFMKKLNWKPDLVDVFAGKLYYPAYPFFDRFMIKLIMIMTKGPTHTNTPVEYTDWNRVKAFGDKIIESFK
ncbi:MAG: menaquinone-dependent protoporphyrinogen IX dehydrogenase [Weeksellaceae bacterium]